MPIIEVKNIGKKYNITHRQGGYITLRDVLTNVFSNPFRFLKQKAKAVAGLVKNEEFWALKDVSFNVEKGEVIGIIGRNGAGKSTLLKILSQITPPTTGEIRINGRVGSLLEVGTGFHPELSGRENIFLNGAILGMKKSEIAKKFDEIVEFAGIEKFLDTPVKYYSSGMYVRLAFSVAAHMEPDVLIIDEVLAVGDADFQKKCLGKMDEITKKEGRTILFVSHNMAAIEQLCKRCILLEKGEVKMIGETDKVISTYLNINSNAFSLPLSLRKDRQGSGIVKFTDIRFEVNGTSDCLLTGRPFKIIISLDAPIFNVEIKNVLVAISLRDETGGNSLLNFSTETFDSNFDFTKQKMSLECDVSACPVISGRYLLNLYCEVNHLLSDYVLDATSIRVDDSTYYSSGRKEHESHSKFVVPYQWRLN